MQTKFYYIRDEKLFPAACIAFVRDTPESTSVKYGFSVFHPDDKFNKARARSVAEARMNKYQYEVSVDVPKVDAILNTIFDDLLVKAKQAPAAEKLPVPSRLRKLLVINKRVTPIDVTIATDALTYTIDTEEIPDDSDPTRGNAVGYAEITRSDGKKIRGDYIVEGGKGSLRGGGWWKELSNDTELDEETAGKALIIANDWWYEEGDGPHPWDVLVKEAQRLTDW